MAIEIVDFPIDTMVIFPLNMMFSPLNMVIFLS